jgi:hypothetical protein
MELNEAIDTILDYLRDKGEIYRELESGPWISINWSVETADGELRGKVTRLKDNNFRYDRMVEIGTLSVRSVFGQGETIYGGSAADIIEVANRLSNKKMDIAKADHSASEDQARSSSPTF